MKLDFEYGHGLMSAVLPDSTKVFIPGETVPDPPCLPQDWDSLYAATLESIRHPMGMQPLRELAGRGKTAVFVIPDIVKGGTQPTSHRKVAIRACLDELYAAGVEKKDILLLFSNGLHPRATVAEMRQILGEELFNEFYWTGQITSHDSEDPGHMVDLGTTGRGDPVTATSPSSSATPRATPTAATPAATSTAPPASPTGGASPATTCRR